MPECTRCDRYFHSSRGYDQHIANSTRHNVCYDCDVDFTRRAALEDHWTQSPHHSYCQYCGSHFDNDDALEEHYIDAHEFCHQCRIPFKNEFGLKEHYRQSERHHYCFPCDRQFISENNLRAHLNSAVHRPRDVICPFRCGGEFVSQSALILHFESGACTSGINRNVVDRTIRQYDRNNIITDPSRLLTSGSETSSIQNIATHAAWNGRRYECYLCHNTYPNLNALNQHLASPRHQDRIYVCREPRGCGQRFSVLSALFQHVESEKCGVSRFRVVQNAMNRMLGQMGRLTM